MRVVFWVFVRIQFVALSMCFIPLASNAEIKNFSTTTAFELVYPNGELEGRIGKSLLLTLPDGKVVVFDTRTDTISHTIPLKNNQRLWSVKSTPGSNLGVITIQTTKKDSVLYGSYTFAAGDNSVWDGNEINGDWSEVYSGAEDVEKERKQDYLTTRAVSSTGDVLLYSNLRQRQVLIKNIYAHLVADSTEKSDTKRTGKGGGIITFNNDKNTDFFCLDDDATHLVTAQKSDSGNYTSLSIRAHQDNKFETIKTFELPEEANNVVVQCYGSGADSFKVIIDLVFTSQVPFKDIPPRSIIDDTSSSTNISVSTVRVTSSNSNVMRIIFDGTNEFRSIGNIMYIGKPQRRLYTPVAHDAYIDIKSKAGESVLMALDDSRGIKVPDDARALIDYPIEGNAEQLYCVFGQKGSDVYKSCYTAKLK